MDFNYRGSRGAWFGSQAVEAYSTPISSSHQHWCLIASWMGDVRLGSFADIIGVTGYVRSVPRTDINTDTHGGAGNARIGEEPHHSLDA
jgi:hypothetical protein